MKLLEDKPLSLRIRVKIKTWKLKIQLGIVDRLFRSAQWVCPHVIASIHTAANGEYFSVCDHCDRVLD